MLNDHARRQLIEWFRSNGRNLPWRRTRDPYRIMVSEVMLQQTQVERVIPKYLEFLQRFPTLQALADAPASEVIRAWSGLGYNRRALNLQRACRIVTDEHGGEMPMTTDELMTLPGIGRYTAGAIACFAYDQDVGFVDTNIRRVLHRVAVGPELPEPSLNHRAIESLAAELVPVGGGYVWNQALIELGATICRAKSANCTVCPVADSCNARNCIDEALAAHAARRKQTAQPRFELTSRYFRGRIVEYLRQEPHGLSAAALAHSIQPDAPDPIWIQKHIDGLLKDGLIVRAQVPKTAGTGRRVGEEASCLYEARLLNIRYTLPE